MCAVVGAWMGGRGRGWRPYLFLRGRCEEAVGLYKEKVGADVLMMMRFKDNPDQPPPAKVSADMDECIMHAAVRINGALRQTVDLSTLVRDAATLLADVEAFMTLQPGDVLMLGTDCLDDGARPRAQAGDRIEISAPGFAPLVNPLVEELA